MSRLVRTFTIARSLVVYHGVPGRQRRLRRLYRQFVGPGDLAFDLGAHVGNRTRALRALGCRVVALEPQADCARLLRGFFGGSGNVEVIEAAAGATAGRTALAISDRHPTMTTTAAAWRAARERDPVFAGVRWNAAATVEATTLDALIARFGMPAFVKIDVEGAEPEVLAGLGRPPRGLSFEYLPGALDGVRACVERLAALGAYRYNWSPGETYDLASADWMPAGALLEALQGLEAQRRSGDVYARLEGDATARPEASPRRGGSSTAVRFDAAAVRRYYDRHTAGFVAYGQGGGAGAIHRAVWGPGVETRDQAFRYVEDRIADQLRTLSSDGAGLRVVDLGCGVGGSLCYLAGQLAIHAVGVTLSPVQARLARDRIRRAGLDDRIRCIEGDYADPSLALPTADLVYAIESFVHGPDPPAFFAQCARLIRPGGLLAICDDVRRPGTGRAADRTIERFRRGWRINTLVDREELRALATAAGFDHHATLDLSPHLELARPRDRAIAVLAAVAARLPLDAALGHLVGGSALRTCLRRGWIGYDFALFRRQDPPAARPHDA